MSDLIDREQLLHALHRDIRCKNTHFLNCVRLAPAFNHWIPCSERMPENIKPVYITWRNPFSDITGTGFAHYFAGNWYWYSQFSEDILGEYGEYDDIVEVDVIAWMPTPEAYKPPEGGTDNA